MLSRRGVIQAAVAGLPMLPARAQPASTTLQADAMDAFLQAAGWQPGARQDLTLREQLPFEYLRPLAIATRGLAPAAQLPQDAAQRAAILNAGLAALGLGVAQWGVSGAPAGLADPQADQWRGPPTGRGKHLVSVTDGGIGLPHYDTDQLGNLLRFALAERPEIGTAEQRARIPALSDRFRAGMAYKALNPRENGGPAQRDDWLALIGFSEAALGRREVQHWVLSTWIEKYWIPSLAAVGRAGGSFEEVFVNARIRNSSPRVAACALQHAATRPDRIAAELDAYATPAICAGANPRHRTRFGYMQRPIVVWRQVLGTA